jgi:thymidylate synthase (FAD)
MKYFDVTLGYHDADHAAEKRIVEASQLRDLDLSGGRFIHSIKLIPWNEIFHRQVLENENCTVTLYDCMGDDLEPLRSARLSTGNPTGVDDKKDNGLRSRLWGDAHTSPFESNVIVIDQVLPLFVLRQQDRHRTVNFCDMTMEIIEGYDDFRKFTSRNEFSARYAELPDMFWIPPARRIQRKGTANKQGSEGDFDPELQRRIVAEIEALAEKSRDLYARMINIGVASEIARIVIPPSQITKIRIQASFLNMAKFLALRLKPDVQEETRLYAEAISDCTKLLWPKCHDAFVEHTYEAVKFSRSEAEIVKMVFGAHDWVAGQDPLADVDAKIKSIVFNKLGLAA